ncbi:C1 family peptidase [Leptospira sp. 96542]|nr:C1 family peptidase [Leptospira sp. 96542]
MERIRKNGYTILISVIIGFLLFAILSPKEATSKTSSHPFQVGLSLDNFSLLESIPRFKTQTDSDLPNTFDMSQNFPAPPDQGRTKSSVGYAVGYGLISYLEAKKKDKLSKLNPKSSDYYKYLYSPSFVYSQLNSGKDQTVSLLDALVLAESRGSVSLELLNEDPSNFRSRPKANLIELGRKARTKQIFKIDPNDLNSFKKAITEENPVLISFLVYENFFNINGETVFDTASGDFVGAQSLVVLGFNDKKKAFRVWNSWGTKWASGGYAWIGYEAFQKYVKSAFISLPHLGSEFLQESKIIPTLENISYTEDNLLPPKEVYASRGDFSDRIRISWSKQKRAIGYEVYRKRKSESKFQLVGLSKQTYLDDFGVQKNTAYSYRVASVDESYLSLPSIDSNDGYAEEPIRSTNIMPITNLTANVSATNDRIILEWDKQTPNTSFAVYKWNTSSKIFRFLGRTEKNSYTDFKAVRNGDSEIYQVVPEKNSVIGEPSHYVSAYLDPMEITKPNPKNLLASKGLYVGQVQLQWEGSPKALRYHIYKNGDGNWNKIAATDDTKFQDSSSLESYYAVVSEFADNVFSLPSEIELGYPSLIANRSGNKEIPTNIEVFEYPREGEVKLVWKKSPKTSLYKIYFRKKSEKDWALFKEVSTNSISIKNLEKNQFYIFAIQSVIPGLGESLFSETVTAVLSDTVNDIKKIKTFGESSIQKFIGPWTAMYWDGENKVKPIRLTIETEDLEGNIRLKWNETEIFRGKNVVDSDQIEEKGKWKIKLSTNADSLSGEFQDKVLLPEKSQLSFVRE